MAVPRGVDDTLPLHGHCVLPDSHIGGAAGEDRQGDPALWLAAAVQLFLASLVFPPATVLFRVFLADCPVGPAPFHNPVVFPHFKGRRVLDAPVSSVGDLRRVSESGDCAAELTHFIAQQKNRCIKTLMHRFFCCAEAPHRARRRNQGRPLIAAAMGLQSNSSFAYSLVKKSPIRILPAI